MDVYGQMTFSRTCFQQLCLVNDKTYLITAACPSLAEFGTSFAEIWASLPETFQQANIFGRDRDCKRYQLNYGRYFFPGSPDPILDKPR